MKPQWNGTRLVQPDLRFDDRAVRLVTERSREPRPSPLAERFPAAYNVGSKYPGEPVGGSEIVLLLRPQQLVQAAVHSYVPAAADPSMRPALPDLTGGGAVDLDSDNPADGRSKTAVMVEIPPTLPFWPGTYSRTAAMANMSDYEVFVRSWKPKQVPPYAFTQANGWTRLPHPCPCFVPLSHFGTSLAYYWRMMEFGGWAGKPILLYAVRKLQAMPFSTFDQEWGGPVWEMFAAWVKPMKWAISQFPTAQSIDPANVHIVTDQGTEFVISLDQLRSSRDPRLRAARNAFLRDYPHMEQVFSIVTATAPPELLAEDALRNLTLSGGLSQQQQQPPPQEEEAETATPETAPSGASIIGTLDSVNSLIGSMRK